MDDIKVTERTRVKRQPDRGSYDRTAINAILDDALICHIGFVHQGTPVVIPTIHGREGDTLFLHGSPASRMLRTLQSGQEVCVSVTVVDGLVVARSLFNSSMNYRSVTVFGTARETSGAEKLRGLKVISDHVLPGRWEHARPATDKELAATMVLAIPIDEASAKIRHGPPVDETEDCALPIWAGVIPLKTVAGSPEPDPQLPAGFETPPHVGRLEGPRRP